VQRLIVGALLLSGCGSVQSSGGDAPGPDDAATADGMPADAPGEAPLPADAAQGMYASAVLADTPVAYWRLGDTGLTAVAAGGGINGIYEGGVTQGVMGAIPTDRNTAAQFDGQDDLIRLGTATDFDFAGTQPFSIEAWIKPTLLDGGARHVFTKQQRASPKRGFAVLVEQARGLVFERYLDDSEETTVAFAITEGAFLHVVAVYTGASMRLHVNGAPPVEAIEMRGTPSVSAVALIGSAGDCCHFAGVIDEVAVYDKALDADRIEAHFRARLASDVN
jgi:uncharacterized protein YceK